MGGFPTCDGVTSDLDWVASSGDITCMDGLSGTITKSGSTWSAGNNISPPCASDTGFTMSCTSSKWTAELNNTAAGVLIGQTSTSLTWMFNSPGTGGLAAGLVTIVVTLP